MVTTAQAWQPPSPRWWQQDAQAAEEAPYLEILSQVERGLLSAEEGLRLFREQLAVKPCGLFFQPRLGKTGTTLLIYQSLDEVWGKLQKLAGRDVEPLRFLIVAPNRIMSVWEQEIRKWLPPKVARSVVTVRSDDIRGEAGTTTRAAHLEVAELIEPRFVILSYEFFARDTFAEKAPQERKRACQIAASEIDKVMNMLARGLFQGVVFDESHNIGNSGCLKRENIEGLYFESCLRIALTGTPFPNKIDKLKATLDFTHPGRLRVEVKSGQFKDVGNMTPQELEVHYKAEARKHRLPSPEWGSDKSFLEDYGLFEEAKLVSGRNLTAGTCTACSNSRCRNTPSRYMRCPHMRKPIAEKLKFCVTCNAEVPEVCQACDTPLHNRLMAKGFHRRTKAECLPESDTSFDNILCRMTPAQEDLYQQIRQRRVIFQQLQASGQMGLGVFELAQAKLAEITAARLVACDPEQWYAGVANRSPGDPRLPAIKPPADRRSGKIEWMKVFFEEELDNLEESKVCIFTEWSTSAEVLGREFAKYSPVVAKGGKSSKNFDDILSRFTNDDNCRLFIGTSTAFEGVDLSARGQTGYIVMLNPFWIPGKVQQAVERATNPQWARSIQVLHLLSVFQNGEPTVELSINKRNVTKVFTQDQVYDGGDVSTIDMFDGPELDNVFANI